ncbi:MAG: ClpX C4-type zinc finger protein [Cyanobacteria bacterium J06600_6]
MIRRENTVVKRCSFCGRDKKEALLLIAGIEGHICDVCISHAEEILQEEIPGYYHKTTDQSSEPDDRSSALEFPKAPSPNSCSFCGRVKSEALTLVAGINGYICDICIIQAEEIVREEFPDHSYLRTPDPSPKASNDGSAESGDNSSEPEGVPSESQADPSESNYTSIEFNIQASPPIACSFCGRDKNEALILIAGAKGHICEVCVDQAQGIVEDELYGVKKETKTELPEAFAQPLPKIKNAIVALSQELIIEERQVSELTQIFSNHYRNITENVSNYTAPNLFLVGPTGSGKSFVFEKIAGKFGFPITIVDSVSLVNSSFSEKENFLYNHFKNAGMKINLASVGIVVFKNIDKLISLHPDGQNLLNGVL